jgi:hypothetical protein
MGSRANAAVMLTAVLIIGGGELGAGTVSGAAGVHHGVTRFSVPNGRGGYQGSTSAYAAFPLPNGTWKQMYGALSGTVAVGAYRRMVVVRGTTCAVNVFANSRAQGRRPNLADPLGLGSGFMPTASGTNGDLRWVIGRLDGVRGATVAYAYEPTPRGLAPKSKRWTFYWADLRRELGASIPMCERLVARTTLRETIRYMHLVRGALHSE